MCMLAHQDGPPASRELHQGARAMSNPDPDRASEIGFKWLSWGNADGGNFLLVLICAYIALVPALSFVPPLEPYNEKRALQIGVLLAAAAGVLGVGSVRGRWLETFKSLPLTARWGLGGVLGLGVLSSVLAPAPFYAFLEVGHFFLLFVVAGIVASEVRRAPGRVQQILLGTVVSGGALYTVYFGTGYLSHLAVSGVKLWPNGGTNYVNIRIFNHYQTVTLPLFTGVFLLISKRRWIGKGLAFMLIALWWALILASEVRGTVIAVGIGAAGVGLFFRRQAKTWIVVQSAGLLTGLGLYYLLFTADAAPPVTGRLADPDQYSSRLQLWRVCLEMAWINPVFGIGPMHFAWAPYPYVKLASPHSALMQWLAEWGLPSTLATVWLAVWGLWRWIRQEAIQSAVETSEAVRASLVASVLAGAAHSMVSGLIVAPLSQMLLALVGGWAWGRYKPVGHADQRTGKGSAIKPHFLLSALLVGSIVLVGSSFKDLATIEERRSAYPTYQERFSPRYWNPGHIGLQELDV